MTADKPDEPPLPEEIAELLRKTAGPEEPSRIWWILGELALLGIVVLAFVVPAAIDAREGARRSRCKGRLKQMGLALHNYHDTYGAFPPAYIADETGKPLHSWRVLILPYVDGLALYKQYRFDEPWDSPHNRKLAASMPSIFQCPSYRRSKQQHRDGWQAAVTNYAAITGPGTAFDGPEGTAIRDIPDGSSNTILVVEMLGKTVPWTAPEDISAEEFAKLLANPGEQGHQHTAGAHALRADGAVRFLRQDLKPRTVEALTTIAGGEPIGEF